MKNLVQLVDSIDLDSVISFVSNTSCGAVSIFLGTVRSHTKEKAVKKLLFEGYAPMAIKQMELIIAESNELYGIEKMAIQHVLGEKYVGEQVVAIAASAPHRQNAMDACTFAIDTLKKRVPIWKKEFFDDGAIWVSSHP